MIEILGEDKSDFAVYFGKKNGSRRYIGFHFPLHNGWCSATKGRNDRYGGWRIKGGWEYYECAFLLGRTRSDTKSRWVKLPTIYVPAKLNELWRLRKREWRQFRREDAEWFRKLTEERANTKSKSKLAPKAAHKD